MWPVATILGSEGLEELLGFWNLLEDSPRQRIRGHYGRDH